MFKLVCAPSTRKLAFNLCRRSKYFKINNFYTQRGFHQFTFHQQQPESTTIIESENEPKSSEITIDDFMKVEIVVGQIIEAQFVKKSKKLICFKVDIGEENPRQILSGIRLHYPSISTAENIEELNNLFIGQQVLVVKNLQPKSMANHQSHGMIMFATRDKAEASSDILETITPVAPKERLGVKPGTRVY